LGNVVVSQFATSSKESDAVTRESLNPTWLAHCRGTRVIRRENGNDVTGTVLDANGTPVAGVKFHRLDGAVYQTNDQGQFRLPFEGGCQSCVWGRHPDYSTWFGAPTAGDVLRIELERKPPIRNSGGNGSIQVFTLDAKDASPIAGVTIEAVCWEGPRSKTVDGISVTNAHGVAQFHDLAPVRHHFRLSAREELPYVTTWRSSGPSENKVYIPLKRACELILRAVDADTGRGIQGVKFGRERALAELWLQVIVPDTLGSKRPVRYEFDANPQFPPESDYETDEDGYYRCLVGPETWSYTVYSFPSGYDSINSSDGKNEVEIKTPSGGRVEYVFRLLRKITSTTTSSVVAASETAQLSRRTR